MVSMEKRRTECAANNTPENEFDGDKMKMKWKGMWNKWE